MGFKIKLGGRQPVVPAGEYHAKVIDIRKYPFIKGKATFEFTFEVVDGSHCGVRLRGFVNAQYESFSEYTKLRRWLSVITKLDDEPGTEVDLNEFFGKVLRVEVKSKNSKKTGNEFSNVTEVLGIVCDLSDYDPALYTVHPSTTTPIRGVDQGSTDHGPEPKSTPPKRPHQARRSVRPEPKVHARMASGVGCSTETDSTNDS